MYLIAGYSSHQTEKLKNGVYTFDEAVALTHIGRFHYKLLITCGLCFLSVMTELSSVGTILPALNCDLQTSIAERGALTSAGFVGVVLSSHAVGFLADTWGRVRTLRLTLLLSLTTSIISAFSVHIWMLIGMRMLVGFFVSGCQACVFTLCGEFHSDRSRGRHIALMTAFMPLSNILVPILAMFILPLQFEAVIWGINFTTWRILMLVYGSLSILALIGLFTLPESPKYSLVQGDAEGALKVLKQMYVSNTGLPVETYDVKSIVLQDAGANLSKISGVGDALRMVCNQTAMLFAKERLLQTLNLCLFMFVLNGIIQSLFMWLPSILDQFIQKIDQGLPVCQVLSSMPVNGTKTGGDDYQCGAIVNDFLYEVLILAGCIFTTIYLVFAFLIDLVGKKNLLLIWLSFVGCFLVAIHFVSEFHVAVVLLTLIISAGNCAGIVSTLAMEFFPANINAMGISIVIMISRLGAVAGSNVLGHIIFKYCDITFWAMLGIISLLCTLGSLLPEKKQKR